jgi:predicted Zn finger-like uncharacterized protein
MRARLCSAAGRIANPRLDLRHEAFEGRDMNIACPICDASYEVPESVLTAHRPLRCARCGHDWIPGGPEPAAPEPEPPSEIVAEAPSAVPEPETEPDDDYDEFVAAKQPETITTADIVLATELADDQVSEPAPSTTHPAPFVPPRPIAPRPTLGGDTLHPTPVQPRGAWIASLAALAVLVAALLIFHAPIKRTWPPMARLYSLVGM